jgi:hypothetical protein
MNVPMPKNIQKKVGNGIPTAEFNEFLKDVMKLKMKK